MKQEEGMLGCVLVAAGAAARGQCEDGWTSKGLSPWPRWCLGSFGLTPLLKPPHLLMFARAEEGFEDSDRQKQCTIVGKGNPRPA